MLPRTVSGGWKRASSRWMTSPNTTTEPSSTSPNTDAAEAR